MPQTQMVYFEQDHPLQLYSLSPPHSFTPFQTIFSKFHSKDFEIQNCNIFRENIEIENIRERLGRSDTFFYSFSNYYFLWVLVVELWASCCVDRHSTTWAIPPTPFALVILEIESYINAHDCLNQDPCIYNPHIAGMTGVHHHTQSLVIWGLRIFLLRLASNHDLPDLCLLNS
jgi:hypothetical protein